MLVDNAVVVTESVFRQRELDPENPIKATLKGVQEVGIAVIAGTLTTIIVFVPIMFGAQTDISVFMTHVGITIIVALLASLFIAQPPGSNAGGTNQSTATAQKRLGYGTPDQTLCCEPALDSC